MGKRSSFTPRAADKYYTWDPRAVRALTLPSLGLVITNPPWTRAILHPMIEHWVTDGCWLLFDSDWMHTKQSAPYMPWVRDIVSVGRMRWIEGSTMDGKDSVCWYRFDINGGPTRFHGR